MHFLCPINLMFSDIADVCVLVYFDDILLFSKNELEHKQYVHAVFKKLAENNFCVKHKKCTLFTDSIEFLNYIVSYRGIEVCLNTIAAIKTLPVLTTVCDVL